MTKIMTARHPRLYDRAFGADPAFWRAASPTLVMASPAPPMLLVCLSRRREACGQADGFAAQAARTGGRAEVLALDLSHAEINRDLGLPGPYTATVDRFLTGLGPP